MNDASLVRGHGLKGDRAPISAHPIRGAHRYSAERLFAAGALDVFVVPGQMKKGRPGFMISVICAREPSTAVEAASTLIPIQP